MEEKLPEGWVWTTLGDICTIIMGQSPPSSQYNEKGEGLPFFQGKAEFTDFYPYVKKWCTSPMKIAEANDILLSVRAPVGPTNIAPSQCCIGRGLAAIRPEGSISFRYILYIIRNFNASLIEVATGSTFEAVSGDDVRVFKIPLAPLSEQSRIVAAIEQQFTRLDSAVASLQSAKARIKQYRASLLKSAVEGELTKEWRVSHPASEAGTQLLERILKERRARWEQEYLAKMRERGITPKDDTWKEKYREPQKPNVKNLPELPDGWCWATVEQVADVGTGATPLRSREEEYYRGGTIPWITSGSVNNDFIISAEEFITQKALAETNAKIFPVGSLILAMYGEGKTRGKISELKVAAATNQACAAIVFRPFSFLCQPYTKIFLMSNYLAIRAFAMGGVQPNLNLTVVKETAIPLPPLSEQAQIVAEVEAKLSNIAQLEATIEADLKRAEHERQSILREAFAGRLVAQDPNDEPASVLLERIRQERKQREEAEQALKTSRKTERMENVKKRRAYKIASGQQHVGLYEKLVDAGQRLPPDDLFRRVGLKTDEQPESTSVFYRELQVDEDILIEVQRPDDSLVLLEALEPSDEVLNTLIEAGMLSIVEDAEQPEDAGTPDAPLLWENKS